MEGTSNNKIGMERTISDHMEEVAKQVLTPAKRTTIGRSASEQLEEVTKEVLVSRKSSVASIGRTSSYTESAGVTPPLGHRKPPLAKKMTSPRVSSHAPKLRSGGQQSHRIEDELTNAFFEEVALSRASSATSHGLSFSIAGPVMAPSGDLGLIHDLQEARIRASMALKRKETELVNGDIEKSLKFEYNKSSPLPIYLKFVDVKYRVILKGKPTNILGRSTAQPIFFEKEILHNVTGYVSPGEVLAMMGPSGSGKTSLINLLSGRMQQNVLGSITYNEQAYTKSLKRRIGFVTQDDVLYPHLTVKETLVYTALLRLPRTLTKEQKSQRAEEVIHELGLERCKDTIIGGSLVRGVSGGERKRVCIGCEILIDPSLLFLDEPTSGLDSTTALKIVHILREMAEAGRTVVTTIHQPSSRLFHKFDKLILLGEGHPIYFGKASEAMMYFASIGFSPFIAMNPADFLLDLASGNISDVSIPKELEEKYSNAQEEQQQLCTNGQRDKKFLPPPQDVLEHLIAAYNKSLAPVENERLSRLDEVSSDLKSGVYEKREWGATWCEQFTILCVRGFKERRHEYLSLLRVAQVLATAFLLGGLWWQSKIDNPKDLADQTGLVFFIAVFWGFFPVFTAIFTFPQERAMLTKERSVDMYRVSAYFLARNLSDLPLDLLLPLVYLLIVYFMAHLRMTVTAFALTVLTTFLSIVASQGLGLAIGAAFLNLKNATTLASVTMMAFMLAGGFFVQKVPVFMRWIRYLSFNYYTYRILLKIQYDPNELYDCRGEGGCKSIADSSTLHGIPLGGGMKEAGIMLAMVLGYRLLAYYFLTKMKL